MAHTQEQRSAHALCGARKKSDGSPCRKFAGEGTDHFGLGRCRLHGGATPSHKSHAVGLAAKARMVKMGAPVEGVQPHEALLSLLRASAGHVGWLQAEIADLDDLGQHESAVLLQLYSEERDRLTRVAAECSRAGVADMEIKVAEAQITVLGESLYRACESVGLTPDTMQALGAALRTELAAAEAPGRLAAA
jgi:hypothetical protein